MAENLCCSFCEELPTIARPSRGSPSKCPLCKQALWRTPDGNTQRVVVSLAAPARSSGRRLAGVGIAAAVLCVVVEYYVGTNRTSKVEPPVMSVKPTPIKVALAANPVTAMPVFERPSVQAKPALPSDAAQVKPAAPPALVEVAEARSVVKPIPVVFRDDPPTVKPAGSRWSVVFPSEDHLKALLSQVPQVDLDSEYAKKTKAQLATAAQRIVESTRNDQDAFVRELKKDRADLAGLPFLMGEDCKLEAREARLLAVNSLGIRETLGEVARVKLSKSEHARYQSTSQGADPAIYMFWAAARGGSRSGNAWLDSSGIPALRQILGAENKDHRAFFTTHLKAIKDASATRALANLAVFDFDADVRRAALEALLDRPRAEYRPFLMNSLRYPWAPIAHNAANAVVHLGLRETVPELATMLDEPDPAAPFPVVKDGGKPKQMIRELVRVNHHRNCMLCHAPVSDADAAAQRIVRDLPVGPVTSAEEPLPPSASPVYYSLRKGITVVRADITYLRQDFSVMQKVEERGKWPAMQRFDFFVRTRELTDKEAGDLAWPAEGGAFKDLIHSVLCGLTGENHPPNSRAWYREVLAAPTLRASDGPLSQGAPK